MSSQQAHRTKHRGFATILAIVLIGLIGATLAGMAAFSAAQVRRSHALADGARLRQFLLAGAADVMAHTPSPQARSWTLALPDPLKDEARVEIELTAVQNGAASAQITATLRGRVARQTIRLVQTGANWELAAAELDSQ